MKETAELIKIEGNVAYLKLEKRTACAYCHACMQENEQDNILKIANIDISKLKVGNMVTVNIKESLLLLKAFLIYILPLFLFVATYLLGDAIARTITTNKDLFILIGSIFGFLALGIYYFSLKLIDKKNQKNPKKGFIYLQKV